MNENQTVPCDPVAPEVQTLRQYAEGRITHIQKNLDDMRTALAKLPPDVLNLTNKDAAAIGIWF